MSLYSITLELIIVKDVRLDLIARRSVITANTGLARASVGSVTTVVTTALDLVLINVLAA
jgi:hypothetical protein